MTVPRGWAERERDHDPEGNYQAVCGHYIKVGTYVCRDCNLAPLSSLVALRDALQSVLDGLDDKEHVSQAEFDRRLGAARRLLTRRRYR
jgi:hypothetical protein